MSPPRLRVWSSSWPLFDDGNSRLSNILNGHCQGSLIAAAESRSTAGKIAPQSTALQHRKPLYTTEQRKRRDASPWTLVQGVLAPLQFAVFFVSLVLISRFLATGEGWTAATASVVIKTLTLYAIMITGSIWEREVFGRYLLADAFYWEDVVSMLVLALHTLYLAVLLTGAVGAREQMLIALAAYAAYVVNAAQFLLKLRTARLQSDALRR
ncbi:MAG: 2-vinyl bacteriochlorophyllide hydratase, partial [Rhodospirillales bacterium]|nr:2-vinyl bacteriochlorophyllide hydratase [Rhodospirillales bacterium]